MKCCRLDEACSRTTPNMGLNIGENMKPCKCCKDNKPGATGGGNGYGFNRLEGEARQWAAANQFAKSEFCVPVKDGKKFGGPQWQKTKCGDGRMGFTTRRRKADEGRMERELDGQFKRKRMTLLNRKSARSTVGRRARRIDGSRVGLVSSVDILNAMRDPIIVDQQRKAYRKSNRARNRNNRARRGYKQAMKLVS